jgi:hypothetical protein
MAAGAAGGRPAPLGAFHSALTTCLAEGGNDPPEALGRTHSSLHAVRGPAQQPSRRIKKWLSVGSWDPPSSPAASRLGLHVLQLQRSPRRGSGRGSGHAAMRSSSAAECPSSALMRSSSDALLECGTAACPGLKR